MTTARAAPILWFDPPDVALGQGSPAGQQIMDLFDDPAAWQVTAGQSAGIVLTEYFILTATDQQLSQVFGFLAQRHLKMMMVTGMIPVQADGFGNGVEGYAAGPALADALQRIASLGGTLDYVAMDTPLSAGHEQSAGPQLSIAALAQQVAPNVALIKAAFPDVQFEDGEGLATTGDLVAWAQAFQAATGSPIAETDADVNWSAPGVAGGLEAYAQAVRATGAVFGIIGDANSNVRTDQAWALAAEANIAMAAADPLIRPADILVATFNPNPTTTLPEGEAGTLSHVAAEAAEIVPLYAAGALAGGAGLTVSTVAPTPSYAGSAADAVAGAAVAVPGLGLTIVGTAPAGTTFAVVVTDVSGVLGATASGTGQVSGAGSDVLLLTGGLADIDAELASLTYAATAAGPDTIDVTTYDGTGLVDDRQIAVAIAAPVGVTLPDGLDAAALYANVFGQPAPAAALAPVQAALADGQDLAQAAALWLAQAQATLGALCARMQGSSPTPAALASLVAALAGGEGLAQIGAALAAAAPVQSELAALYQNRYGQAPTAAQLAALTQLLAGGAGLQAVEAPLLANGPAEAQVAALYQQVEGQAPDAFDLAAAARALLTGTNLATLRGQLAAAPLVQANLAALFQHVYDVAPTAAQLAALTAELAGGTSYAQIQAQFTAVAQATVTASYQSALDRSPTAAELAYYTSQLAAGAISARGMLAQLAYSAESGANVAALYQRVTGQAPPQSMVTTLEQCLCIGQIPLPQLATDLANAASLYQQITGQNLTADALAPLMYDFLNKAPVSQIRYWTAFSAQENQLLEDAWQSLFGDSIPYTSLRMLETELQAGTTSMPAVQAVLAGQAAADVPMLLGVVARQHGAANAAVAPFGAISLYDTDPNALETATVSLSLGDGHLAGAAGLNASGTLYARTATAALVQGDLRALELVQPTGGAVATLWLTVRNGAGHGANATVAIGTPALTLRAPTNFVFMPAAEAVVAAQAGETFVFPTAGFAEYAIDGFSPAQDLIQLPQSLVVDFAALHMAAADGGTVLTLGPAESIALPGIAPGSLQAADFRFV